MTASQRWYKKHREQQLAAVKYREIRLRYFLTIYKDQPCADCRRRYPAIAMDFDHRPGERKMFVIGHAPQMGLAIPTVLREIAKCDVVCSNCHRVRTAKRAVIEVEHLPEN